MSTADIRRRTHEKLAGPVDDEARLRCTMPGCPNRWTVNFSRGRICGACDARASEAASQRQLLPLRNPSAPVPQPVSEVFNDDEPLPF